MIILRDPASGRELDLQSEDMEACLAFGEFLNSNPDLPMQILGTARELGGLVSAAAMGSTSTEKLDHLVDKIDSRFFQEN